MSDRKRRKRDPSAPLPMDTPATFGDDVNWDNILEDSIKNPSAEEGIVTLVGPTKCNDEEADVWMAGVKAVRSIGLRCQVLPDDLTDEDRQKMFGDETDEEQMEYTYIDQCPDMVEEVVAFDADGRKQCTVFVNGSMSGHWLLLRCENEKHVDDLQEYFSDRDQFTLAPLSHVRKILPCEHLPAGYRLVSETGGPVNMLGTKFSLFRHDGDGGGDGKLVGRAQCAYRCGEIETAGPTLEAIDIATEWRGRGLGTGFLKEIERFYRDIYDGTCIQVEFWVGEWDTGGFGDWLEKRGYKPIDGPFARKELFDHSI